MQLRNYLLMIGTAIGAGIFALPVVVKTIGVFPFLLLLVFLACVTGFINYLYYRVVRSVRDRHQLTGYAKHILGKQGEKIAAIIQICGLGGAMVAFLALGANYTSKLFGLPEAFATIFFWLLIAVPFFSLGKNLELFDYITVIIKLILFGILGAFAVFLLSKIQISSPVSPSITTIVAAYGAILFSLTSFSIVPELKKTPGGIVKAIVSAQGTMIVLYGVFAIGFSSLIGPGGAILTSGTMARVMEGAGIIAVYTPYMLMSWVGYDMLNKDLGFSKNQAKILVMLAPLLVVLLGIRNFDFIIAITGGIFLSSAGIMIAEMHKSQFPGKHHYLLLLLQGALILGIVSVIIKLVL